MTPSTRPADRELLRDARRGDRVAFARLVDRHYAMLLVGCRRMLRDPELAREAAQEAVIRALLGLDGLRDDTRFGAWLVGIGLNVCRSLLTARARRAVRETPLETAAIRPPPGGGEGDPVRAAETHELAARVHEAIAALPAGQRRAVALFYLGGLTHAEIAEEIGTASGAVKTRLHKARHHLRASLIDTDREPPTMTDPEPELIDMQVAELRRTAAEHPLAARHVVSLHDGGDRRLSIWIGLPEANALAVVMEDVQLPRPGVYQFTAGLLAAAGAAVREVHITELTDSTFYARTILADGSSVDARPSDAITLALVTGAPIRVARTVIDQAAREYDDHAELIRAAEQATDDARVIAEEVRRRFAESARLEQPPEGE